LRRPRHEIAFGRITFVNACAVVRESKPARARSDRTASTINCLRTEQELGSSVNLRAGRLLKAVWRDTNLHTDASDGAGIHKSKMRPQAHFVAVSRPQIIARSSEYGTA